MISLLINGIFIIWSMLPHVYHQIRLIKYMMHYLAWNLELLHQNIPLSHGMENHILLIHWEADQDLTSAMHNSVNWYFQAIDSQAGFEAVRTFLQTINYGNQNTGTNLNLYWTDFSLKISPIEQVELLQDFYQNNFHFDSKNIQAVKKALLLSTTSSGSLYGKTGTGRVNGKDVNGWFIGYIETANNNLLLRNKYSILFWCNWKSGHRNNRICTF